MGGSQDERGPHLGESKGNRSGNMGRKVVDSIVKEGRFQGGEGGLAQRTSLGESISE